ncbi:hypothetical protein SDC9_180345 [bioreactor metagenome]|uniref:Uncharacterized protein n=1 Tax=bioreactor metagenome TaxID=1076179 RepID=A0A645H3G1_9ZZZZ
MLEKYRAQIGDIGQHRDMDCLKRGYLCRQGTYAE